MENEEKVRPIRAIRRARLRELLRQAGGPKQLMELTGATDTHLIAIEKGRREVGDDLASSLEARAGKEFGWMDRDPVLDATGGHSVDEISGREMAVVEAFRRIDAKLPGSLKGRRVLELLRVLDMASAGQVVEAIADAEAAIVAVTSGTKAAIAQADLDRSAESEPTLPPPAPQGKASKGAHAPASRRTARKPAQSPQAKRR